MSERANDVAETADALLRANGCPEDAGHASHSGWGWPVVIVAIAAALRLATLGHWPIWIDEAFTLHDAHDALPSYPLGYLMTRWMVAIAGDSEWSIRLLPCLFGIATVAVLTKRGYSAAATARDRLAALLLALSSWHLFWSQSARYYAPLIFFLVVAARAIPTTPDGPAHAGMRRWSIAVLALGLAALCHPSAAFFLPGAMLLSWPMLGHRARQALLLLAATGAGLVLWRYAGLFSVHTRMKGAGSTLQLVTSYGFQAGPVMLVFAAVGLWGSLRQVWRGDRTAVPHLELCFAALPAGIFLLASVWLFITGYHAVATLPFAMMLAARGAWCSHGRMRLAWIGLLISEQIVGLVLYHGANGMRPDFRQAAAEIAKDAPAVVFATQDAPLAYYLASDRLNLRYSAAVRFLDDYLLDDMAAACKGTDIVWVLIHEDDLHDWSAADRARLDALMAGGRVRSLPGSFGPKSLALVLRSSR